MKSIKDFNVKGKKVLVRCDFNVPIDGQGNILDDFRIQKTLPTIQHLLKKKAKVILMSHLGEPNGVVPGLRLDKVRERLEELLGIPVLKTDDCVGELVTNAVHILEKGQILLLENIRFHKEEVDNSVEFAKQLAGLGEIYINDAFGDCHRAHASIVGIPQFLPSGAGFLLQDEVKNLDKILKKPKRPLVALVGGIKVETKAKFIKKISQIADLVLVSGLIKQEIEQENLEILHPAKLVGSNEGSGAKDIDQASEELFKEKITKAKTIIWNGPFGKFEQEEYKHGTLEIAKAIVKSKAFSVVGGGETIEFLHKEGMLDDFSHVSTGGGAMLSYIADETLPGLKAIQDNE